MSRMPDWKTAYIGLGGNVGDVVASMRSALQALNNGASSEVTAVSNVYTTPPWGFEGQDWFLNCCAEISTNLSPEKLLTSCLDIEKSLKRERNLRWGPRTIDLDILTFADEVIQLEKLAVPHPRMHERLFVLQPFSDIAPNLKVQGKSIDQWLSQFNDEPLKVVDLPDNWWQ